MSVSASPEETPGNAKPKTTLLLPLIIVAGLMLSLLFVALRTGDHRPCRRH